MYQLCKNKGEDEAHLFFDSLNYTELRSDFITKIFTNEDYFETL